MSTIKPDQLAQEIMKTLDEWKDVTEDAIAGGIIATADKAVDEIRASKPAGAGHYGSWDEYLADWTRTSLSALKGGNGYSSIIYNKKHYQLAHLLEKGHALKQGGRTVGHAQAFPHLAPVAERAENELLSNIKKRI